MSSGVQEQWAPKVGLPATPSRSKIPWTRSRSPGWAAFDHKQRGKKVLEPDFHIDPYIPFQSSTTSTPLPKHSVIQNGPTLKSFSSVVQPPTQFPVQEEIGNYFTGKLGLDNHSNKFVKEAEIKDELGPSIINLKKLHPWADYGLIEDILAAVNNDIHQASTLLKSMILSGHCDESNAEKYADQMSEFEIFCTNRNTVKAEDSVPHDDLAGVAELTSASDECVLNCTEMTDEDTRVRINVSGRITNVKLNSRYLFAAPVEPEWVEEDIYLSNRKDAIRATRSASQHSRAASNAFMRGDHISARELSLKAQEEWMAAEVLNANAAAEILNMKNRENDIWKLDLHGLHASEAVQALHNHLWRIETEIRLNRSVSSNNIVKHKALSRCSYPGSLDNLGMATETFKEHQICRQRATGVLQVVTGTGNHSRGHASLPMAVRSFLNENGYRFDDGRPGVIDVWPKFRHR